MKIDILGGQNEIGGNKILVEHKGTRILLDFGMSFGISEKFFSEFLQPRTCGGLTDFFHMDLLPDIPGIYRQDFRDHMGRKKKEKLIDAVFLSHAHADHSSYLHFLHWDIPVYCTKATKKILEALQNTGSGSIKDFVHVTEKFRLYEKNKNGDTARYRKGRKTKPENKYEHDRIFNLMDEKDEHGNFLNLKVKIGSLEIECCPVDHSLPGACGYIIYSDQGNLAYSGDIRFHGYHQELSHNFVNKLKSVKPKWLLIEGTRIDSEKVSSEKEVQNEFIKKIRSAKGIVFIEHPIRDLDRILSIYQASKATNRTFVVNLKLAYLIDLLDELSPFSLNDVKILIPKKNWGFICFDDMEDRHVLEDYSIWERDYIHHKNAITIEELQKNPKDYVVSMNMWEIKHLIDIQPEQAIWIKSSCIPFNDDMELDEERKKNWLNKFNIEEYHAHASGHASGAEIREMINKIGAEQVIPIHTEHPELFKIED